MERTPDEVDTGPPRELTSTGALSSGPAGVPTPRRGAAVAVLTCALLLALGLLVGHRTESTRPAPAPQSGGPRVSDTGRAGFAIDSDTGSARIVVAGAQRVPSTGTRPALETLEITFRMRVGSGFLTLTTESFAITDPGGAARFRASSVTVVQPGPRILPADGGFRILAPSSVEVDVFLDVPTGEHVVSVLGAADDRPLATFAVTG